ncbi:MAG: hypothetical protein HZB38_10615 [Planctomycetes bacterium]|nr:hypothetical protein [Planctomycetota bacterium]
MDSMNSLPGIVADAVKLCDEAQMQTTRIAGMLTGIMGLDFTIRSVADNAEAAKAIAKDAESQAQAGDSAIKKCVEALMRINQTANQMNEMIETIREIANQTNLLALNAAIEAARAGKHGAGFAVVAGEVRKLADRSSAASKEIAKLIRNSVDCVHEGVERSGQAGGALAQILAGITRTSESVEGIAAAASEQATTVAEVSTNIQEVATSADSTVSLAERLAASLKALSDCAAASAGEQRDDG